MTDAVTLVAVMGFLCLSFALLAALADWMGEPERWESRRRNR